MQQRSQLVAGHLDAVAASALTQNFRIVLRELPLLELGVTVRGVTMRPRDAVLAGCRAIPRLLEISREWRSGMPVEVVDIVHRAIPDCGVP